MNKRSKRSKLGFCGCKGQESLCWTCSRSDCKLYEILCFEGIQDETLIRFYNIATWVKRGKYLNIDARRVVSCKNYHYGYFTGRVVNGNY